MLMLAALMAAGAPMAPPAGPSAKPVAAARPNRAQVAAAVRAEWHSYDTDQDGKLTPLEFATWVMQSHGAAVAPVGMPASRAHGIPPVSAMNETSTAFARADADHDGGVTPDEMVDFLMRGMAANP